MRWLITIFLCFLLGAGAALAQNASVERRTVEGDVCGTSLPAWATPPEHFAWRKICAGEVADMNLSSGVDDEAGCDAKDANKTWPASRILRSRFVQLVVARQPYVNASARPEVRIRCARFDEQINLEDEVVSPSVWIDDSRIPFGLLLYGARFDRDLSLDGSFFGKGKLDARSADFGENLFLQNGTFSEVSLGNARVAGVLAVYGAHVSGVFRGGGLNVAGDLILRENAKFAEVKLVDAVIGGDLDVNSSHFSGKFDAEGITVGSDVFLNNSAEFGEVRLIGAMIGGDLDASGSQFRGKLSADRVSVAGQVSMSNGGAFEEVSFPSASIGSSFDATGSRFDGTLEVGGIIVGGSVFLKENSRFASVLLIGADIQRGLDASGSQFTDAVIADRVKVGEDLDLGEKADFSSKVSMIGADIGGDLVLSGSHFKATFSGDGMTVNGNILMRNEAEFAGVDMPAATIRGVMQLQTSTFSGPVRLPGLTAKELSLWQGGETDPKWGVSASLNLRNAKVESLQARIPQSWVRADGKALPVDLQGFRYERLGGLGSGVDGDLSRIGHAAPLIAWIEAAGPVGGASTGHAPQPYFQLETSLRAMGAGPAADEVAYARHLHRMSSYGTDFDDWVGWIGEWVWRLLVGFGVYPFRLLWWFALLVLLGGYLARKSECLCTRGWRDCFWYSLENAFPLLETSAENKTVVHERPLVRNFFHFQKVAGFVLATILVGTLTLLGG